jgi:uncharacterized membrane protein YbhN (UPF0104 family)
MTVGHHPERAVRGRTIGVDASPQLFAAAPGDARGRRPIDAIRAVVSLLVLGLAVVSAEVDSAARRDLGAWLTDLPTTLDALWAVLFWAAIAWAVALVVITAFSRRLVVALEAVGAAVLALVVGIGLAALVSDQTGDVLVRIIDTAGPTVFPPGALAVTCAVQAAMAPHVTLPFRRLGRLLAACQLLAVILLGVGETDGAIAAVAIGVLSGTVIHLLRGSPDGFPTMSRIRETLLDLGLDVTDLAPVSMRRDGVVLLSGADRDGSMRIKVYGRDAWEGALLASIWRSVWYRGTQRSARLSRSEYVEHEGFLTFLAATIGARVPRVITAAMADNGDALIAVRPDGTVLNETTVTLTEAQLAALWQDLGRLHAAGIAHRRIDLDRIATRDDDTAGFADLSSASVGRISADRWADCAQLFALAIVTSGEASAITAARAAVGMDGLGQVLPYLQEAALPPQVRAALNRPKVGLDKIRGAIAKDAEIEDVELAEVRRVTWKSLLSYVMLGIAAYTLIGTLGGLDLGTFARSLRDASWSWLLVVLIVAQLPRPANALSTLGSTMTRIPFGPTTALQFAKTYVSLAVPTSAGQIAVTTRFFQRFGVPAAAALSAGVIDSVSEMIVQLVVFVIAVSTSDADVGLSISPGQLRGIAITAGVIVLVVVVVAGIVMLIPPLRRRLIEPLQQAREAGRVLRSPAKLAQLFGGNFLSQVLFACALWCCVHAFGEDASLGTLLLVNTVVSLFAGFIPVPGGVGVTEGGLALGLTHAAGIPPELALAIALTYRFATAYLPPVWGLASYRWLTDHRYL